VPLSLLPKGSRVALYAIAGISVLAILGALIAVLNDPIWWHANEAAAIGELRDLIALQRNYAVAHPGNGFACELSELRSFAPDSTRVFDTSASHLGYSLTIRHCSLDSDRKVAHYQASATPLTGRTDARTFCVDDSEQLWYNRDGSPETCLQRQLPVLSR